jgi:hypothetical protein
MRLRAIAPRDTQATNAPVAQLDRALDYESRGQEFESLRARHFATIQNKTANPGLGSALSGEAKLRQADVGSSWHTLIFTMTQIDARITELVARLTELERERVEIVAEINTLRSVQSEGTAATKVVLSGKAGDPIDRNSTIEKKIALFRRLFAGRSDVFPIRWENRTTGRSGYAPACANEWQRGICEKPKVKCSACPNQAFLAVDDVSIERHLRGTDANGALFVMGVYPMVADNTCSFLAADFDDS